MESSQLLSAEIKVIDANKARKDYKITKCFQATVSSVCSVKINKQQLTETERINLRSEGQREKKSTFAKLLQATVFLAKIENQCNFN